MDVRLIMKSRKYFYSLIRKGDLNDFIKNGDLKGLWALKFVIRNNSYESGVVWKLYNTFDKTIKPCYYENLMSKEFRNKLRELELVKI